MYIDYSLHFNYENIKAFVPYISGMMGRVL